MDATIPNTVSPQKRPWFQLHLITIVILAIAAGTYMLANSIARHDRHYPGCLGEKHCVKDLKSYGFPYAFFWDYTEEIVTPPEYRSIFFSTSLTVDAFVGLIVLYCIAQFCEWSLRRAERLATSRRSE